MSYKVSVFKKGVLGSDEFIYTARPVVSCASRFLIICNRADETTLYINSDDIASVKVERIDYRLA